MRPFYIVPLCLALAACAPHVLDEQALAGATVAQSLANDRCEAAVRAGQMTSVSLAMACALEAKRQFLVSVKFTKMDIFETHRQRVMLAAAEYEAGHMTADELKTKIHAISVELQSAVVGAYAAQEIKNAQDAAALEAFGAGLQNAAAAMKGPDSVNCTSIRMGDFTNTNCH